MPRIARYTAGALALAALLATSAVRPIDAHAADVIPPPVAALAYASAAQSIDHRPHTAQLMVYSTPAERGDQFGHVGVAVWEEATSTCSAVGVVVRDSDSAAPSMVAAGVETQPRGVCWLYGLTTLPLSGE